MAAKSLRPLPRTVTPAAFAKLQQSLQRCTESVEELKSEIQINVKRMGAMQAEIDRLRAQLHDLSRRVA